MTAKDERTNRKKERGYHNHPKSHAINSYGSYHTKSIHPTVKSLSHFAIHPSPTPMPVRPKPYPNRRRGGRGGGIGAGQQSRPRIFLRPIDEQRPTPVISNLEEYKTIVSNRIKNITYNIKSIFEGISSDNTVSEETKQSLSKLSDKLNSTDFTSNSDTSKLDSVIQSIDEAISKVTDELKSNKISAYSRSLLTQFLNMAGRLKANLLVYTKLNQPSKSEAEQMFR